MIKLLHSADWHIDVKKRFQSHVNALLWMVAYGIEQNVDAFMFVGDFSGFDAPHHARTKEILALLDIYTLASSFAPTFLIPGNHDEAEQFQIFLKANISPNFHLILQPGLTQHEIAGEKVNLLALPWMGRKDIYNLDGSEVNQIDNEDTGQRLLGFATRCLTDRPATRTTLAMAHFAVLGGYMGEVEVSSNHDITLDVSGFDALGVDYTALGHFHRRQSIPTGSTERRAWYSGSPVPLDFSESDPKGFNLVDITPSGTSVSKVLIPSWRMVTIDCDFDGKEVSGPLGDDYTGSFVRVNVNVPSDARLFQKTKAFAAVERGLKSRGALGIKINRLPMVSTGAPKPAFLKVATVEEKLAIALESRDYDIKSRERILTAFRTIRDRRIREIAESGRPE